MAERIGNVLQGGTGRHDPPREGFLKATQVFGDELFNSTVRELVVYPKAFFTHAGQLSPMLGFIKTLTMEIFAKSDHDQSFLIYLELGECQNVIMGRERTVLTMIPASYELSPLLVQIPVIRSLGLTGIYIQVGFSWH